MLSISPQWPLPYLKLFLAVSLLTGTASATDNMTLSDTRKAELTRLVRQDCGSCHGMTLKGGLGKPLLPENLAGYDAPALASIILNGIPGTPMPPWQELLSHKDARWIAQSLKNGTIRRGNQQ